MRQMISRRTTRQKNLMRYMAYRLFVWKALNDGAMWKALSGLTGIHKSDIAAIKAARSSSKDHALQLSQTLGPTPLEAFMELADQWAAAYPAWSPDDPLPDPVTHLSLSTEDRWAEMSQRYPLALMRAGRAVLLLEDEAPERVTQDAVDLAWASNKDDPATADYTAREWYEEIERALKRLRRGSGERASAAKIKLVRKE